MPRHRRPILLPDIWLARICSGSIPAVLATYTDNAVLIPTYDTIKIGKPQMAGYFKEFMGKPELCGTIDSVIVQKLGTTTVYSGVYTFNWRGGSAEARYTFVTVGSKITTHHSSETP